VAQARVRTAPAHKAPFPARGARRRGRNYPIWIGAAAVIVFGCAGAGIALATHDSGPPRKSESTTTAHHAGARARKPASPRATVEAYIAAISAHLWWQVWQLGGKNLSQSYSSMLAGFHNTSHDVIERIVSHDDTVTARVLAYEKSGVVQVYEYRYTVRAGKITSGHQHWIATRNPAASQPG
jgi:hypothetical protein